jgi:hypothetical protein
VRTRLAALGAACALLVPAGCGPSYDRDAEGNDPAMAVSSGSVPTEAVPSTATPASGGTAGAEPAVTTSPGPASSGTGTTPCLAADLGTPEVVDGTVLEAEPTGPGKGSGQLAFDIRLRNTSDQPCTLAGYVGLELRGELPGDDRDVVPPQETRRLPGPTSPVTLEPDGTTLFGVVAGSTICLTQPASVALTVATDDDPLVVESPGDPADPAWFCYDEGTDVAPYGTGAPDTAIER